MFRCLAMAAKKRGLIRRLFGSKKTSFDGISADEDDVAALQAFQSSSAMLTRRRHTIDVETFRGETSDKALIAAASKRTVERHRSDGGLLRRLCPRLKSRGSPVVVERSVWQGRSAVSDPARTTKSTSEKMLDHTASTEDPADANSELHKNSESFRRRANRRDRLLRCVTFCKVDPSQPIVYPTTPETILEYHKAMPFLDENEEWLMVELNEYECLVDGIEIIKIIANHSKFFEVEPDDLWEEFFEFVDDVPAYDEVINFDVWQEFRDKKYTC